MRKLLPETIRRRAETKRRMEEYRREWDNAMSGLDELACKTPQDPYSDERDYNLMGENDGE